MVPATLFFIRDKAVREIIVRKLNIFFVILVIMCASSSVPSWAQQQSVPSETQQGQITIVNNTSFPIWYVYIVSVKLSGENVPGKEFFPVFG